MEEYIVYAKVDEQGRIVDVNSSVFLETTDEWIEIDRGSESRHMHAQGNYFDGPIYDENGIPLFKMRNGKVKARTAKEINEEKDALFLHYSSAVEDV